MGKSKPTVSTYNHTTNPSVSYDVVFSNRPGSDDIKDKCLDLLRTMDFRAGIQDILEPIYKALPNCQPCDCMAFYEDNMKSIEETIEEAKSEFDCSSEASSVLISVDDLDDDQADQMVEAAQINEYRKPNILTLPFTEEYLPVKSVIGKHYSEESFSRDLTTLKQETSDLRPVNQDAWKTGLHDMVGLYAYDWEKLVKNVIGQGKYSRDSSREPFFRFELPCNLELLSNMTPTEYLEKYCVISDRRLNLYQKEFIRYRDTKLNTVQASLLYTPLNYIMVSTLTQNQYETICRIFDINSKSKLSMALFTGICAVTERLYFCQNLSNSSEESLEIGKGFIESADFRNLKFKIRHVQLPSKLKELLFLL